MKAALFSFGFAKRLRTGSVAEALFPFLTGFLCVFVSWGRLRLAPLRARA